MQLFPEDEALPQVCVAVESLSHAQLSAIPWTVALQAPLSMGFPRQGYWSGLPFPSPGDLPAPGIELLSPALQLDFTIEPPGKPRVFTAAVSVAVEYTVTGTETKCSGCPTRRERGSQLLRRQDCAKWHRLETGPGFLIPLRSWH